MTRFSSLSNRCRIPDRLSCGSEVRIVSPNDSPRRRRCGAPVTDGRSVPDAACGGKRGVARVGNIAGNYAGGGLALVGSVGVAAGHAVTGMQGAGWMNE